MNMETVIAWLKIAGSLVGIVGLIVLLARVLAAETLREELKLSRERVKEAEDTVKHYRKEMHDTRAECEEKLARKRAELDALREREKRVEIENASLKARTDLTPVMETMSKFIQEQTDINGKILEALTTLLERTTR